MWLRNAWYVAGWREEATQVAPLARCIVEQPLVLYRTSGGAVVALEDRCCHRLAPLSLGRLEGDDLRCMYHGLRFAPDGRCVEIPGQRHVPAEARVRRYPAVERGAWIWVWMGDDPADPALIPATVAMDDPGWRLGGGALDYAADYRLINDNLLDLSHLAFVHERTLGRGAPQFASQRPRLSALERGLRFERWLENYAAPSPVRAPGGSFDLWHAYDFLVPGIFVQRTVWFPSGTARRLGWAAPAEAPLFVRLDEQAVTPVGPRASRYYFAAGARSGEVDRETVEKMRAFTETAFHEDKVMIEAQQARIDGAPGRAMLPTSLDAGPTRFRRLMADLQERENTPVRAAQRSASMPLP